MFERVVIDDAQEITDLDAQRLGTYPQAGIALTTEDLLIAGRFYKGFTVSANADNISVTIAPGRLYDSGEQFASTTDENHSLSTFIPISAGHQRYVTLYATGTEENGPAESRLYLREIVVPAPTDQDPEATTTTTQQVPETGVRTRVRRPTMGFQPGPEAVAPTGAPAVPAGTVAIADILVGTAGVESIAMRAETRAPDLEQVSARFTEMSARFDLVDQALAGIRQDMAALEGKITANAPLDMVSQLAGDVALLKDDLSVSDAGAPYGADRFLDTGESQTGHVDFDANVEEGIRFPHANFWRGPLAALYPNDTNLRHVQDGFLFPNYHVVDGLVVDRLSGETPLGGVTYQTLELREQVMSRQVTRYGDYFTVCTNSSWWRSGRYNGAGTFRRAGETYEAHRVRHKRYRVRRVWTDLEQVPYTTYVPVDRTLQGVIKSQSFTQSQARWVPGVRLFFNRWSEGAQVALALCRAKPNGDPDFDQTLATVTLTSDDFKVAPASTRFPFPVPVFLEPGFYCLVPVTTGEVYAGTVDGSDHLSGTLSDTTDGITFLPNLMRDLAVVVEHSKFDVTRLQVPLEGLNLDGGIHNMAVISGAVIPENTSATFQVRIGGAWRPLATLTHNPSEEALEAGLTSQGESWLNGDPFYDFAVELTGTEWVMPVIGTADSELTLFRADTAFVHLSDEQIVEPADAITSLRVTSTVAAWDAARHTLSCTILHGAGFATEEAADTTVTKPVVGRIDGALKMIWTFTFAAPIETFMIKFSGATTNDRVTFHVEERIHERLS